MICSAIYRTQLRCDSCPGRGEINLQPGAVEIPNGFSVNNPVALAEVSLLPERSDVLFDKHVPLIINLLSPLHQQPGCECERLLSRQKPLVENAGRRLMICSLSMMIVV